ncbi:MAG: DEAD/DEAH box helicase [Akkermansia sp.]|nr:DEAD/DEAH box helicase [Akkermansia sp.]
MRILSSFQQEAIEKLRKLKVGALFMGCGTGKTQTASILINSVPDVDLLLWICPFQTKTNLQEEIEQCGLRYRPVIIGVESIGQSDRIYLETRELVRQAKRCFMVVDESLKIKNIGAKRTQRLLEISRFAEYKLILNGTPITKNICDVYAQMAFLSYKILNMSYYQFCENYCCYSKVKRYGRTVKFVLTGYANVDHLVSIIKPYVYQCDLDLSLKKRYVDRYWLPTPEEYDVYNALKEQFLKAAENLDNDFHVLGMLQKMQHSYCCAEDKMRVLRELVTPKTIIYCKFIKSAEWVKSHFPGALVLTYGKNSFGLNLQSYNRIVYFDKTFDYAFREQSEARIYRTGQQDDCEYFDMSGDLGLEDMIDRCISNKLSLVDYFKKQGRKALEEL